MLCRRFQRGIYLTQEMLKELQSRATWRERRFDVRLIQEQCKSFSEIFLRILWFSSRARFSMQLLVVKHAFTSIYCYARINLFEKLMSFFNTVWIGFCLRSKNLVYWNITVYTWEWRAYCIQLALCCLKRNKFILNTTFQNLLIPMGIIHECQLLLQKVRRIVWFRHEYANKRLDQFQLNMN